MHHILIQLISELLKVIHHQLDNTINRQLHVELYVELNNIVQQEQYSLLDRELYEQLKTL